MFFLLLYIIFSYLCEYVTSMSFTINLFLHTRIRRRESRILLSLSSHLFCNRVSIYWSIVFSFSFCSFFFFFNSYGNEYYRILDYPCEQPLNTSEILQHGPIVLWLGSCRIVQDLSSLGCARASGYGTSETYTGMYYMRAVLDVTSRGAQI